MKCNLSGRVFALVLAALGVLALAASAHAAERPYAARGTAQLNPATGEFVGAGTATYLGLYSEAGSAQLTPIGNTGVFQVNATSTYTRPMAINSAPSSSGNWTSRLAPSARR
jgi:hypothetical protein